MPTTQQVDLSFPIGGLYSNVSQQATDNAREMLAKQRASEPRRPEYQLGDLEGRLTIIEGNIERHTQKIGELTDALRDTTDAAAAGTKLLASVVGDLRSAKVERQHVQRKLDTLGERQAGYEKRLAQNRGLLVKYQQELKDFPMAELKKLQRQHKLQRGLNASFSTYTR
ncbi:MAG TPA: hypothetical protein VH088_07735 [Terriglobales bacterium]|jgi:chromosome segregation ATPase|nr:hypothetical protein [Terriglobales bacterium]